MREKPTRREVLRVRELGVRGVGRAQTSLGERAPRTANAARTDDERRQRVLATIDSIPRGKVASYGQIAREAWMPGRARWVGRVLGQLPAGSRLAWHRVVNSAGRISFPVGSPHALEQRRRLMREGVEFRASGAIDLARFGWKA